LSFLRTIKAHITIWSKICSLCYRSGAVLTNGVFTRSSKRPANFQQMYSKYTC